MVTGWTNVAFGIVENGGHNKKLNQGTQKILKISTGKFYGQEWGAAIAGQVGRVGAPPIRLSVGKRRKAPSKISFSLLSVVPAYSNMLFQDKGSGKIYSADARTTIFLI